MFPESLSGLSLPSIRVLQRISPRDARKTASKALRGELSRLKPHPKPQQEPGQAGITHAPRKEHQLPQEPRTSLFQTLPQ